MSIVNPGFTASFVVSQINALESAITQSTLRISSGKKLLYASDNPSGVISAKNFTKSISGVRQALYNAEEVSAMLSTADSAMESMEDGLIVMRDTALKAMNDATLSAADLAVLDDAFQAGEAALDTKVTGTEFNGNNLLDGTYAAGKDAQVGPNNGDTLSVVIPDVETDVVTPLAGLDVTSAANATIALAAVDAVLTTLSGYRAGMGAYQVGLNILTDDLNAQDLNFSAALMNVEDVDMASEIANFAKLNVTAEAASVLLGEVNNLDEMVIGVLQKITA